MSNEMLSAAVDDAATAAEWDALLEAVDGDAALTAEWGRVWTARDAREGVKLCAGKDFCGGVMAAIANETMLPSNVVDLASRRAAKSAPVRIPVRQWRSLLPLSAAAGVVAAVLFMGNFTLPGTGGGTGAEIAQAPLALATTPVAFNSQDAGDAVTDEAKSAILNAYLMEHSNTLAERSMGGTLANARFAARTADYRPDAQ